MNRSTFVRCQTGNNNFADCEIYRRGDLLRFVGYSQMDFTRADALQLAEAIMTMYRVYGLASDAEPVAVPEQASASSENASLARAVSDRLGPLAQDLAADRIGVMDTLEAVRAIQETALTAALFLERLHDDLARMISDGR